MKLIVRLFAATALLATMIVGTACAHEVKAGDLLITKLWSRATPGGAKVGGGYATIENRGTTADRLISASSPVAGKVEIHQMATANGVMTMRPLDTGLAIDPGKTVTLAPGGLHIMMMDLNQPLKEGEKVPITLLFERAGKVDTFLHIRGIGAQDAADDMKGGDDHSGMKM